MNRRDDRPDDRRTVSTASCIGPFSRLQVKGQADRRDQSRFGFWKKALANTTPRIPAILPVETVQQKSLGLQTHWGTPRFKNALGG